MPIGPTHRSRAPRPEFVGRTRELEIVESLLNSPQPLNGYKVLSLYGIGGQGKTTLLDQIDGLLDADRFRNRPSGRLDFRQGLHRDKAAALIELRNQMQRRGLRTDAFDIAYARYYAVERSGRDIRKDHPELFRYGDDSLLAELIAIVGSVFLEVPGGKLIYSLLARMSGRVVEWYKKRGSEILHFLEDFGHQELLDALPMFFGYDLCAWMENHPDRRPVLLFDTYEALWKERQVGAAGTGDTHPSAWLRRLVEESPGALAIISGRRPVAWERVDPDWKPFIISHRLDDLDERDQLALLDSVDIDKTEVRQRILETAKGHPLSIQAQIRIYEKICQQGRVPRPGDFPVTQKEILDRLLDHMDPPLRAIIRALAVPEVIHRNMWRHLSQHGFSMFDVYAPRDVYEEVGFTAINEDRTVLHERVREHIIAELAERDPEFLKRTRLAVFDFYDKASSQSASRRQEVGFEEECLALRDQDERLGEAMKHLLKAAPNRFPQWCLRRLSNDVAPGGSKLRRRMLQEARESIGAIDAGSAASAICLAKLEIEGNPLSTEARDLADHAIDHIGSDIGVEAGKALVDICWHLLNVGETSLIERLESALNFSRSCLERRFMIDLRLANLRKNRIDQRALIEGRLEEFSEDVHWETLVAISDLSDPVLLRSYLNRRYLDSQDDVRRVHLIQLLDAFKELKKPSLAIEVAAWFYGSRDPEAIVEEVQNGASGLFGRRVQVLTAEVFTALSGNWSEQPDLKYQEMTSTLIENLLTEEVLSPLRNTLNQWPSEEIGSSKWWKAVHEVETETGLGGLLRRSINLLPPEKLENSQVLKHNGKLGWRYLKSNFPPLHKDFLYLGLGETTYPLSRRFEEKFGGMRLELVTNEQGEVFLFHDNPLFCWRESDFALVRGNDRNSLYFYDGGTGWGTFGIPVDERLSQHYGQGFKLLLVCMNSNTGKPLEGRYMQVYFS